MDGATVRVFAVGVDPAFSAAGEFNPPSGTGGLGYIIPGHQILTQARGVESAPKIFVRNDLVSRSFEARVVYRDTATDIALLAVEDSSFFDGLKPLSRESLLPLLTAQTAENSGTSPSNADPFFSLMTDEGTPRRDRGSLALREWARSRNSLAATSPGDDASSSSSSYLVQAVGGSSSGITLADFTRSNEAGRFVRTNVTLSLVSNELGAALRLSAPNAAADSILTLDNSAGWNLSGNGELVFSLKNNGSQPVTNTWILVNAAGRRVSIQTFLGPGSYRNFRIPLVPATYTKSYTDGILKGIQRATYLNNLAMDLAKIVRFQVTGRLGASTIEIGNLVAGGIPMPSQNPFPLVDEFGQYRYYGWD
ncbi:MAG: serine protease, partial [Verrucomicrobiae bacterium]|nr:serine protease [Verrucomicrobiae bacterium]